MIKDYLDGMQTAIDDCKRNGIDWVLEIINDVSNEELSIDYDKGYYDAAECMKKVNPLKSL